MLKNGGLLSFDLVRAKKATTTKNFVSRERLTRATHASEARERTFSVQFASTSYPRSRHGPTGT